MSLSKFGLRAHIRTSVMADLVYRRANEREKGRGGASEIQARFKRDSSFGGSLVVLGSSFVSLPFSFSIPYVLYRMCSQ